MSNRILRGILAGVCLLLAFMVGRAWQKRATVASVESNRAVSLPELRYTINGETSVIESINIRYLVDKLYAWYASGPLESPYEVAESNDPLRVRPEIERDIMELVTQTIGPNTWLDAGGTSGSMGDVGGILIIRQTPENLLAIRALLDRVTRSLDDRDGPFTLPASAIIPLDHPATGRKWNDKATEVLNLRSLVDSLRNVSTWNHMYRTTQFSRTRQGFIADTLALVQAEIDPTSWDDSDITPSRMREAGGIVVIEQTPTNLRAIHTLLDDFRRSVHASHNFPTAIPHPF